MRRTEGRPLVGLAGHTRAVSEMGAVAITLKRDVPANRFAPEPIYFTATTTGFDLSMPAGARDYDAEMHEVHFEWDFGDPGATFDVAQKLPETYRDANRGYGKRVAHLFQTPGTYRVTCRARQVVQLVPFVVVKQAVAVTEVVVAADPHDFGNTVYVAYQAAIDNPGDERNWPGWPADAEDDFKVWIPGPELNARGGLGWALNRVIRVPGQWSQPRRPQARILFRRGETAPADINGGWDDGFGRYADPSIRGRVDIGVWGDEADGDFVIERFANSFAERTTAPSLHFGEGLRFEQDWDDVALTGRKESALWLHAGAFYTVDRVKFSKVGGTCVYPYDNPEPDKSGEFRDIMVLVQNCTQEGCGTYFCFAGMGITAGGDESEVVARGRDNWIALLGNDNAYSTGAHSVGADSATGRNPCLFRGTSQYNLIVDACYHLARFAWYDGGSWPDGVPRAGAMPPLRIGQSGSWLGWEFPSDFHVPWSEIRRCVFDGDTQNFIDLQTFGGADPLIHNTRAEMNIMVTATGGEIARLEGGNATIASNLVVRSSLDTGVGPVAITGYLWVKLDESRLPAGVTRADVEAGQIRAYDNTAVFLCTEAGLFSGFADGGIDAEWGQYENNIFLAPNFSTDKGQVDVGPVDDTVLFTSRYLGPLEHEHVPVQQTQWRFPADEVSLYRPDVAPASTGSLGSLRDVLTQPRTGAPTQGALVGGSEVE